jgi:protein-S-isoprenylcysteine O-methyltransferase Ste14
LVLGRISHELVAWQEGAYKVVPIKAIIFIIAIIILAYFSRASLRNPKSHGFYRLFAWISIVALILLNIDWWFDNPFSIYQMISWVLLIISAFLITRGVILLQRIGKPDNKRNDASLLGMEKTTKLVVEGAYRYIRHPMYSSLLIPWVGSIFQVDFYPWHGTGCLSNNISNPYGQDGGKREYTLFWKGIRRIYKEDEDVHTVCALDRSFAALRPAQTRVLAA